MNTVLSHNTNFTSDFLVYDQQLGLPKHLKNQDEASARFVTKLLLLIGVIIPAIVALAILPVKAKLSELGESQKYDVTIGQCLAVECFEVQAVRTKALSLNQADQRSLESLDGTPMVAAKEAIARAATKYQVPIGFFTGIAHAESGIHKHYYLESDRDNCHNPWGLKPRTGQRTDGSYLICFNGWDESTDYFGRLLREKYLDRGAKTVEGIAPYYKCGGWDGEDWCLATMNNWVRNVRAFAIF